MPVTLETHPRPRPPESSPLWRRPWSWILLAAVAALPWTAPSLRPAPWWRLGAPELERRSREFVSGLPVAREQTRLVVSVLELHKSLLAESGKSLFGVDLGTTRVSLTAPARVHYAVNLSGRAPVRFRVDARRDLFIADFPAPAVQAVEVLTRGKTTRIEPGWARFGAWSGRALEDRLERGLHEAVLEEAQAPLAIENAKRRARPVLARLLSSYLRDTGAWGAKDGFRGMLIRFEGDDEELETATSTGL